MIKGRRPHRVPDIGIEQSLHHSAFRIQNSALPLLTLDRVSLSFGHLPLFEDASLRIEAGERICLIGRNGTGKSSLLKVVSGEVPPDGGSIWRAPGLRVSRLDQDVPAAADRTGSACR